ncbi:MAG: ribosome small subunit-dependent GTPase A [Cyclobacteriaceae bacterium]
MLGRVYKSTGSWYLVCSKEGHPYQCRLRGKFKIKGLKVTNPLTVGDDVVFEIEDAQNKTGIITEIEPKKNYIIRKSIKNPNKGHILAANLDQAVLMVTLAYPRTSAGFIDRFLVTAESFRIPTLLLFNKLDLMDEEQLANQKALAAVYEGLNYKCHLISALAESGVETFKELLEGKTSLLAGHSGVGKSTLINKIIPQAKQLTAEVSDFAQKGVHTTTFAEMFEINPNTHIIDTPGIKELGLLEIGQEELSHYFPEMRALFGACKYYNCTHLHEPKCAVLKAVETGEIAESRYLSYLSMMENDDNRR